MFNTSIKVLGLFLIAAGLSSDVCAETRFKYSIVDGHLHYLNFVQETAGMDALLTAMDEAGVEEAMISGMGLVKMWEELDEARPTYYLDNDARTYWYSATDALVAHAVIGLAPKQRKRLHPFICGINCADRNAAEHVERMLKLYPGVWEGIGELFLHHDELTALTYGEVARLDMKAMDRLLNVAAEHHLPVLMHSDIGPSLRKRPDYLSEIEHALKKHPDALIVWAHAGSNRRVIVPDHTDILRRMLSNYSNLVIDLSWVVFDLEIAPNGVLDRRWVDLIEEFPKRFFIGSDALGFFKEYKSSVHRYYLLLDALKPETAQYVARTNFLSILPAKTQPAKASSVTQRQSKVSSPK